MKALSRQFASFAAETTFESLPAEVVDRAKGVLLQALASALMGQHMPQSKDALALMKAEEVGGAGIATVLCDGTKLTKGGAAFVNSEMVFIGGKWDTYRMLTHPGTAIVPAALIAAEIAKCSGKELLAAIAVAYEVMERMASDFIPTLMARGFHPSPVFGIFGAAVAVAKIQKFDENQINNTIAQCVNLASGNIEGIRSVGRALREGGAVRNALLAVALGQSKVPAGDTALEGDSGFYHTYVGNNRGELRYSFTGHNRVDLMSITNGLGKDWMFLETLYRIYSTAGFNIAHVDVTAKLCQDNDIDYRDIDRIEALSNWFETEYPSPAFPRPSQDVPKVGSTHYFSAYGAVKRGFPLHWNMQSTANDPDPPEVLELMHRVKIVPTVRRTLFGPRVTIFMKNGRSFVSEGTGQEFIWNFDELALRLQPIVGHIAISELQFGQLIDACKKLDAISDAGAKLVALTMPNKQ